MKKLAVSVWVLLLCLICVCAYAEKEGMYTYQINDDNTVTITAFDWNSNHGDIYIPEMLGNRMVSAIGEDAFATTGNNEVKITLPDNIKSIGAQAFRGVSITYVNIPLNTVEIGGGAFAECSVKRFNVADGHPVFATIDNSLYNKQTKTLLAWPENKEIGAIPNGIKKIGDYVFYGRSFSTSYNFSTSYYNDNKESYALPDTIETIGEYSFAKTTGLSLTASGVSNINEHAFEEADLELSSARLSIISDYAFYNAKVAFTETLSLSRIGKHAFEQAKIRFKLSDRNRNNIHLLSTTPYVVDEYAFYECEDIYKGLLSEARSLNLKNITSIGAHAFEGIAYPLEIMLSEGDLGTLTYLGENAFSDTPVSLWGNDTKGYHAYVDLTNSELTTIPNGAFYSTSITDLKIGPTITKIGNGAFKKCDGLTNVELEDGLLTIEDEAFYGCRKLTAISIPASVTMMGNDIFTGCADTLVVTVEAGSYGEVWARTCGYSYKVNGKVEDTSWLFDDAESIIDTQQEKDWETGNLGIVNEDFSRLMAIALSNGILPRGAYVKSVEKGSPAEVAGIQTGDIIVEVQGKVITSTTELIEIVGAHKEGDTLSMKVYRTGVDLTEAEEIPWDLDGEYVDLQVTWP